MLHWQGGEFEPDLFPVLTLYAREFFPFLQGLSDLQDRISPLLVNNPFKRVFKRSLCNYGISLSKGVLSSSVLTGGAFEWLFCPKGREFEQANLQKFKCLGAGA